MDPLILPEIEPALCDGCGKCLPACPSGALGLQAGKAALLRPALCHYDGNCELLCPTDAIRIPFAIVYPEGGALSAPALSSPNPPTS